MPARTAHSEGEGDRLRLGWLRRQQRFHGFPEIIGDKGRGVHGPPSCHASVLKHGLSKLGAANRRDAAAIAARSRLI